MTDTNQPETLPDGAPVLIGVKRYPHGRCYVLANGAEQHREAVEGALTDAFGVRIEFSDERFRASLRAAGVADDATIERYLDSVRMIDEVFVTDKMDP